MAFEPCVYRRVFFKSGAYLIVEHCLQFQCYFKCQDDSSSAFPKYQVPDTLTVFRLVTHVGETGSVSERKHSGRFTVLHDVSVQCIRHYLVQSARKCCTHFEIS